MRIKNTIMVDGKRIVCRIFDLGESFNDRYTIAYKGFRSSSGRMVYPYTGCCDTPFSPQGIAQHGEHSEFLTGKHLGKRVAFESLPKDVQQLISISI